MYTVYRRVSISNVVARRRVDDPQYNVAVDGDQGHITTSGPLLTKAFASKRLWISSQR